MVVVVLVVVRVVAGVAGVGRPGGRGQVVRGAVGGAGGGAGVLEGGLGLAGRARGLPGGREPPVRGLGEAGCVVELHLISLGNLSPRHHGILAGVPAGGVIVLPGLSLASLQCPGSVLLTGSVWRGQRLLLPRTVRTSASSSSPPPGLILVVRVLPLV